MATTSRNKHIKRVRGRGLIKLLHPHQKLRLGSGGKPNVYALTSRGAQVCRAIGIQAHPYGQTKIPAMRHDLYLVELAQTALNAGLSPVLERPVDYPDGQVRPDLRIAAPRGQTVFFELEGSNDWRQRARLIDKVVRWLRLIQSQTQPDISPRIRVLFMLTRDPDLMLARRTWAEAIAAVQADTGAKTAAASSLPLSFWGQSILDFLKRPTWENLDGFQRLDDPALAPNFGLTLTGGEPDRAAADPLAAFVPVQALHGPVMQKADHLRLRAISRVLARHLYDSPQRFSPTFFDAVRDLYAVSRMDDPATLLGVPWVALLTLRAWIHHYPELAQALTAAYVRYAAARRSGVSMTQQFASELIYCFLAFHNLDPNSPLLHIWVARPGETHGRSTWTVHVDIRSPSGWTLEPAQLLLNAAADDPPPDPHATRALLDHTATALQWLLQQLLDHPGILQIKPD